MPSAKPTREDSKFARARRRRRSRSPTSIATLRLRDLNRLLTARYGNTLPNDDAGRDDVAIIAHHLANLPTGNPADRITQWIRLRAPWYPVGELEALIRDAIRTPRRWKADQLAWRMRLTDADRTALGITTIGAIDLGRGSRLAKRRKQKREREERRRRAHGAKPRHEYEAAATAKAKPWAKLGISRRTWYRRGRPQA